ncbi:MAG: RluA family pseudouridine synthase, partial [Erysipelotrichaceae bacterium]
HPIHRLDKETQCVVLFSKSVIFQALLDQLLTYKHIRRTYLAFVDGYIRKGERIVIDAPIGKDRHSKSKQRVAQNGKEAKTIVTGVDTNGNYSIVECELKTGRTHQIRVHMAHIGHPILNDDLYGKPSKLCKDMGLVAVMIDFYHPLKEDMMEVEGYISSDLRKLMK